VRATKKKDPKPTGNRDNCNAALRQFAKEIGAVNTCVDNKRTRGPRKEKNKKLRGKMALILG